MRRFCNFALCAVLAWTPLLSAQGRKVALLVGINDYSESGLGEFEVCGEGCDGCARPVGRQIGL